MMLLQLSLASMIGWDLVEGEWRCFSHSYIVAMAFGAAAWRLV